MGKIKLKGFRIKEENLGGSKYSDDIYTFGPLNIEDSDDTTNSSGNLKTIGATSAGGEGKNNAFAQGYLTTASGNASHAEGRESVASGLASHAQNSGTIAASDAQTSLGKYNLEDSNNQYAVIIGNGQNNENRSNALTVNWNGNLTTAGSLTAGGSLITGGNIIMPNNASIINQNGNPVFNNNLKNLVDGSTGYSLRNRNSAGLDNNYTIGNTATSIGAGTKASGDYSFAEGYNTIASGNSSHAQNLGTIAASEAQTVIGKYNIEDSNSTYAMIIGNGTLDNLRSNALTVDWDGNVYAHGNIECARQISYASNWLIHKNYHKGDTLLNENYRSIQFYLDGTEETNVANKRLTGRIYNTILPRGEAATIMGVYQPTAESTNEATISVWYPSEGNPYINLGAQTRVQNAMHINSGKFISLHNTNVTKGSKPTEDQYCAFNIGDSTINDNTLQHKLAAFRQATYTDGTNVTSMYAYKNTVNSTDKTGLHVYYPLSGSPYILASTTIRAYGGLGTGAKTAWNDSTNPGIWMTAASGQIHISSSTENYGGSIGFHYNKSETTTSAIALIESGKIRITGKLLTTSHFYSNGSICTGEKTAYNDGVVGTVLSNYGNLHLQHNTGSTIYFYYGSGNNATNSAAYIQLSSKGTLKLYNKVTINDTLTVGNTISTNGGITADDNIYAGTTTSSDTRYVYARSNGNNRIYMYATKSENSGGSGAVGIGSYTADSDGGHGYAIVLRDKDGITTFGPSTGHVLIYSANAKGYPIVTDTTNNYKVSKIETTGGSPHLKVTMQSVGSASSTYSTAFIPLMTNTSTNFGTILNRISDLESRVLHLLNIIS